MYANSEWQKQLRSEQASPVPSKPASSQPAHVYVPSFPTRVVQNVPPENSASDTASPRTRRQENIRIAQLCPEDKAKVAKLIEQIVKHGKEKEEFAEQMEEMKTAYESQIAALKDQNALIKSKFGKCLDMLQVYQQKIAQLNTSEKQNSDSSTEDIQTIRMLQSEVARLYNIVMQERQGRVPTTTSRPEAESTSLGSPLVQAVTLELQEAKRVLQNLIGNQNKETSSPPNSRDTAASSPSMTRLQASVKITAQSKLVKELEKQLDEARRNQFSRDRYEYQTSFDNDTSAALGDITSRKPDEGQHTVNTPASWTVGDDPAMEEFLNSQRKLYQQQQLNSNPAQNYQVVSPRESQNKWIGSTNRWVDVKSEFSLSQFGDKAISGDEPSHEFEMSLFELVDEMERSHVN